MSVGGDDNIVLFELADGRRLAGHSAARDAAGVQKAWAKVSAEQGAKAADVRSVYSEWEPSEGDQRFLGSTFPDGVEISCSFPRPESDEGWPAALEAAAKSRDQAMVEQRMAAVDDAPFLAILRKRDELSESMVRRPFAAGLVLCLARVGPTPSGTIGISYVMEASAPEDLPAAWVQAVKNAARGLRVNQAELEGATFFVLERKESLATSILADPGFFQTASKWVGKTPFHVGWSDPEALLVWDPASSAAATIEKKLRAYRQAGAVNLDPAVLRFDGQTVTVV